MALIALILLPVALLVCGYALLVFYWRSEAIRNKESIYYDDRRGPLALTAVVVTALCFIFVVGLKDMIESIQNPDLGDPDGSPSKWLKSTLIYRALILPNMKHGL